MKKEVLESDRLILRSWSEDDADALYRYASDERVCEMALWPRHTSVEMSRQVIREYFIPNRDTFAIVLRKTGEAVGCIGLVPHGDEHCIISDREREVGYWIGYPYWNNGLTTEALKTMINYCRDNLNIDGLLITTDVRNIASQRVAEKCGFRFCGKYEYEETTGNLYRLSIIPALSPCGDCQDEPAF